MSRDVPFSRNSICDNCGAAGAYDFMGDYICQDCLQLPAEGVADLVASDGEASNGREATGGRPNQDKATLPTPEKKGADRG